jgi:hypothetical protein
VAAFARSGNLPHQTNTRLAPNARLIGYHSPPTPATTGDLLPLRLAWREAKSISSFLARPNNFVMFEWWPSAGPENGRPLAQQLDQLPWPIENWGRRAMLQSQHEVIVPPILTTGRYDLVVMLHTSSDPAGQAFRLGAVDVTSPPHRFDLPATALSPTGAAQLAETIVLLGYDFQLVRSDGEPNSSLDLHLYWQTQTLITSRYKVFAQLFVAGNSLAAQSDSFPAAGQRPTTGWLPKEIITDSHSLALSPDLPAGTYRLIAGLYNPLTGERLPILDENGQVVADAIFITEFFLQTANGQWRIDQ